MTNSNHNIDGSSAVSVSGEMVLPAVAIVSVTYNRCEPLLFLLSQLRDLNYPTELFDIYLVDNASADDTVVRVTQEFPEVRLTRSKENLGTSAGFNLGMQKALANDRQYEYIWLLDSDAEVEAETLMPLITSMQSDASIGIIGSTVYDPDNRDRVVATGLHIDWEKGGVSLVKIQNTDSTDINNVELIAACSLLIRTELCRKIGLWDERFWVYWGDTDWCQRVIQDGSRVCGHFKSRVWHRDWANTQRNFHAPTALYDDLRGGLLFNIRHNPNKSIVGARHLVLKSYLKGAMEHLSMRSYFGRAYDEAIQDFINGDFNKRGLDSVGFSPEILRLEKICEELESVLPDNPDIVINQINEEMEAGIQKTFARYFTQARWKNIQIVSSEPRQDFTTDYPYFRQEIIQLLKYCFKRRHDVIITEIGKPHLYTLMAAKYTVLIDHAGDGFLQRNRVLKGFVNMIKTLLKGLKAAYIDLPRANRDNTRLQEAIADFSQSARGPKTVQIGKS